jgi:hypothetical protein
MSSEVNIANLALSHLGDSATVSSLDPPEGSAQAEHCARFYPMARDALLQSHAWTFATKRKKLAELPKLWEQWEHTYAKPADALVIHGILSPTATDDTADSQQPYSIEVGDDDSDVIFSDQSLAIALYTRRVVDTTRFPPMFQMALSWQLASMLAGPVLKGDTGAAESKRCMQVMDYWRSKAIESDANQRKIDMTHRASWIKAR